MTLLSTYVILLFGNFAKRTSLLRGDPYLYDGILGGRIGQDLMKTDGTSNEIQG